MNSIIAWAIRLLASVSAEQWRAALTFVLSAATRNIPDEDRREFVIDQLAKLGIKGWAANFIVEAALGFLKRTKQLA